MQTTKSRQRGAALMTAMAAALILSLTASVVLGLTWRRMQLSVNRKDHLVAMTASDGGTQYVFARLQLDPTFNTAIRADSTPAASPMYVISPLAGPPNPATVTLLINGTPTSVTVDEQVAALTMGNKQIHVAIEVDQADPGNPKRLRIHSNANYGV